MPPSRASTAAADGTASAGSRRSSSRQFGWTLIAASTQATPASRSPAWTLPRPAQNISSWFPGAHSLASTYRRAGLVGVAGVQKLVGLAGELVRVVQGHEPPELRERLGVVLDPQRHHGLPRLGIRRDDEDRRGLAAPEIAPLALGGVECGEQPARERAAGGPERLEHRRPHPLGGHDVGLAGDARADDVAGVGHAGRAGVGRDMTRRVDDRHLARVASGVVRDERRQRLLGMHARGQQVEKLRAVTGVDVGLGGDRADARAGPGHDRADREPVRLDGDAELAGVGVARDDRVRHRIQVSLPPPL